MQFIYLTNADRNTPVIVNAENINTIQDVFDGDNRTHTIIAFAREYGIRVSETAEQILEIIEPERKIAGIAKMAK